jgi:hypothetical protein
VTRSPRNLRRFAEANAFSRLVEPVTVNHFYNLDRTLLPIIVNFALIAADPDLDPATVSQIRRWLDRLVRWRGPERQVDPTRPSSRNNHRYLRDSVTMAWGALIGDNALFFTGVDRLRIALEQMRDDGSLPLETNRGANALFYQRHAISSLVVIAEMAAIQGYDLYALDNERGHDLHHMIRFLVDGIDDPAVVAPYTAAEQYLGFLAGGATTATTWPGSSPTGHASPMARADPADRGPDGQTRHLRRGHARRICRRADDLLLRRSHGVRQRRQRASSQGTCRPRRWRPTSG